MPPVQSKDDERIIPSLVTVWCCLLHVTGNYGRSDLIKPSVTSDPCWVIEL